MELLEDADIIRMCNQGDSDSFRHLVERYQNQALVHSIAILANREDAQDATQEAFVDAFNGLKKFDLGRRFYPWFYVLLRNRCFKLISRRRPEDSLDQSYILADPKGAPDERLAVEEALGSLSAQEREIVTLKYLDGLSYDELSEYLQIPRGTVMSRLFHGRQRLQVILSGGPAPK